MIPRILMPKKQKKKLENARGEFLPQSQREIHEPATATATAARAATTSTDLGTVLVIGGCGFLGYHIISAIRDNPAITCSSIHVLSRTPQSNHHPNVTYHSGDITVAQCLPPLLAKIAPRIIFHCASPAAYHPGATASFFHQAIVVGTANVLKAATAEASVFALIYTSSSTVVVGKTIVRAKEDAPILTASSRENYYSKAKATAETLVLAFNKPIPDVPAPTAADTAYSGCLRTLAIRTTAMYGERDPIVIQSLLKSFRAGETKYQLGKNRNLFDWLYVGNAANAHVLAARALVNGAMDPHAPKVDGEAFFITDDAPTPFWDFIWMVWKAMGDDTPEDARTVIPARVALLLADCAEWIVWAVSLGKRKPALLNRQRVEYSVFEHTYCIDKAKERLGYKPSMSMEEGVRKGVKWALENE